LRNQGFTPSLALSLWPRIKKGRWLARYNPGVNNRQSGKSKTEKTEFTVAGILRDAEMKIIFTTAKKS
jgi:hypothetical protein